MAFAVQLPSEPWLYTGGHFGRKSTLDGRACSISAGAAKSLSRWSGRSGIHP